WFVCPRRNCQRRCSVLYREPTCNARALACRRCYGLRYATQRMGKSDLVATRIDRLTGRIRVGANGALIRPKGMHHRTFSRVSDELQSFLRYWSAINPEYRQIRRALANCERFVARAFAQNTRCAAGMAHKPKITAP